MHDVDKVRDEKNVTLYRHDIGWALRAALCTACAAPPPVRARARGYVRVCVGHSVKNRTVVQLSLTASHPALGCRAFIACTNLLYAFWVTMHF